MNAPYLYPTSFHYWVTAGGSIIYPEDEYERFKYYRDLLSFGIPLVTKNLDSLREAREVLPSHLIINRGIVDEPLLPFGV